MSQVKDWVEQLGGFAQKQELVALGATDYALTSAVREGEVLRARQGWYSTTVPSDAVFRAIRVGGRLTGVSAIREMGGWTFAGGELHVSVPRNGARLRSQWNRRIRLTRADRHAVILHWDDDDVVARGTKTMVAVEDAILRMILDETLEAAVAALDWALKYRYLDRIGFEELILRLPRHLRWIRDWVDSTCDSFPESISRTRLRLRGYRVRTQVPLGDLQRIDLVVEDQVALEVDGEKYHRNSFEADRHKDALITLAGLHALRPTATMVIHEWTLVVAAIEAALARTSFGLHAAPIPKIQEERWRGIPMSSD